jgi:hypothetical protein
MKPSRKGSVAGVAHGKSSKKTVNDIGMRPLSECKGLETSERVKRADSNYQI